MNDLSVCWLDQAITIVLCSNFVKGVLI